MSSVPLGLRYNMSISYSLLIDNCFSWKVAKYGYAELLGLVLHTFFFTRLGLGVCVCGGWGGGLLRVNKIVIFKILCGGAKGAMLAEWVEKDCY